MDLEKIVYVVALIAYLIYSFNKGKKELNKKKKAVSPPREPDFPKQKEEKQTENPLEDILKKFMGELEGNPVEPKEIIEQPQFPKKEKKQKKKYIPPPVTVENYESLEKPDAEWTKSTLIMPEQMKEFIIEKEVENKFEFNSKDAVIYSAILNRPYQ